MIAQSEIDKIKVIADDLELWLDEAVPATSETENWGAVSRIQAAAAAINDHASQLKSFLPIYDASTYGLPIDMPRIRMIYASGIWSGGQDMTQLPDRQHFIDLVREKGPGHEYVIFNIEHLRTNIKLNNQDRENGWTDESVREAVDATIDLIVTLIGWARIALPEAKFGIYSEVPVRDYWNATREDGNEFREEWKAANDYLKPIAASVDVICPSVYAIYDDKADEQFVAYINGMIDAGVKLAREHGKELFIYWWMRLHRPEKALRGHTILSAAQFELGTRTIMARADIDGMFLWDATGTTDNPWPVLGPDADYVPVVEEYL